MNIGEASRAIGLSAGTIRYYEQVELVAPPERGSNGYRRYDAAALDQLRFVHGARDVGFSVDECRELVRLYRDPQRRSAHVKGLVLEKCRDIDARIERLRSTRELLQELAQHCRGDEGPDCAILTGLGGGQGEGL
jgi:MerR family copper efflux transcriptional regulator